MDVTSDPNIDFSPEKLRKTVNVLQSIRAQVAFLQTIIEKGVCNTKDVKTYMGMLRHHYDDLAALLDYDGISKDLD